MLLLAFKTRVVNFHDRPKVDSDRTFRPQDTSAPVLKCPDCPVLDTLALVPNCPGHFGTSVEV